MSVPHALERSALVDDKLAGLKRAALPQAADERGLLQHQTGNNDALAPAVTDASGGKHCHPNAIRSDALYFSEALDEHVGHAGWIHQFGRYLALQDHHPPSGVSSAALGHGRIVQKRSVDRVNAGSARGGPSLAGTGCDAVSEIEAQLPGHRPELSTDVLGSAETQARVRAYAHELRSRHACHGGLHGQAGESPPLRCASTAHRRPLRPSLSAGDHGRPVTALRRSSSDSCWDWKVGGVSS